MHSSEGEQFVCHPGGGVTDKSFFAGEVPGDAPDSQRLDAFDVGHDGRGTFGGIAGEGLG